jgi:hypothetical protein
MNPNELTIEVQFGDEATEDVFSALKAVDARDVRELRQRGIAGIEVVIVTVILASALAGLIAKFARLWKCGVVVDTRKNKVVIEKNCDLPRGSVLIIKNDGTEVTLNEISEPQLQDLLEKIGKSGS